jgi:UDP-2-acetamido-2-deoxy-ribo-hexuluronate aminotransferase
MTPHRDRLQEDLKRRGIPTAIHYPLPLHRQPAYANYDTGSLSVSEAVAAQVISLPMHADLSEHTLEQITNALLSAP